MDQELQAHYAQIRKDLIYALAWRNHNCFYEPITEVSTFEQIIKRVIDGMETGQDFSLEVWELLIKGAREYFEGIEEDEDQQSPQAKQRFIQRINDSTKPL